MNPNAKGQNSHDEINSPEMKRRRVTRSMDKIGAVQMDVDGQLERSSDSDSDSDELNTKRAISNSSGNREIEASKSGNQEIKKSPAMVVPGPSSATSQEQLIPVKILNEQRFYIETESIPRDAHSSLKLIPGSFQDITNKRWHFSNASYLQVRGMFCRLVPALKIGPLPVHNQSQRNLPTTSLSDSHAIQQPPSLNATAEPQQSAKAESPKKSYCRMRTTICANTSDYVPAPPSPHAPGTWYYGPEASGPFPEKNLIYHPLISSPVIFQLLRGNAKALIVNPPHPHPLLFEPPPCDDPPHLAKRGDQ